MRSLSPDLMKEYNREYFNRWYRDGDTRITTAEGTMRKARLALSAAEYMLARKAESVLDVGCGLGSWYTALRRIRPKIRYQGVDPSEYIVERFGKARNVKLGALGGLSRIKLRRSYDLIVCADVVQYVEDHDLRRGLAEIRRLAGGVVFIETFATEDGMEGDHDGWIDRSETVLRRFFEEAGLTHCGFYCWIDEKKITNANRFEIA